MSEGASTTPGNVLAGRETRKMNLYQAVRDAMRYATSIWLSRLSIVTNLVIFVVVSPSRKMTLLLSSGKMLPSVGYSGAQWYVQSIRPKL